MSRPVKWTVWCAGMAINITVLLQAAGAGSVPVMVLSALACAACAVGMKRAAF